MNFDPLAAHDTAPDRSVASLELRSVICVPLVRIRAGQGDATSVIAAANDTVGVLYMDSKISAADLAGGNRELLQTLAIEASTVLENARLLEEERGKRLMEEELNLARSIQQSLLPRALPTDGWLRACGSSLASREVGGDYFDAHPVHEDCWSAVVADVSGKGVSSALLASLLQARSSRRATIRTRWRCAYAASMDSCWSEPAAKNTRPSSNRSYIATEN